MQESNLLHAGRYVMRATTALQLHFGTFRKKNSRRCTKVKSQYTKIEKKC